MQNNIANFLRDTAKKIENNQIKDYIIAVKTERNSSMVVTSDNIYGLKAAINHATKE